MKRTRSLVLEALAALLGLAIAVGEMVESPQFVASRTGGSEFPDQKRGGGTHFRERIDRAKLLGQMPGLRSMARKLREPRMISVLTAELNETPVNRTPPLV